MKQFILYIIPLFVLFGCKEDCNDTNIIPEKLNVKAFRFDQKIRTAKSISEVKALFDEAPQFEAFFLKNHYPSQEILYKEMLALGTSQEIGVLFDEVDKKYADFSQVEKELSLL